MAQIQIVRQGKIVPGQEKRFEALVKKDAAENKANDQWLRDNIEEYRLEAEANPIDFEAEVRGWLLGGDGDVWVGENDD